MSFNDDKEAHADQQSLLPTSQHPVPGDKTAPPKRRTAGDAFVGGVSNVASFFRADGEDAAKVDDPKAALAAAAVVIKFLGRRIIQTIGRLGRPKRKTVVGVLIGLVVFGLFVAWLIALIVYLVNYTSFWRSPTWIESATSENGGNSFQREFVNRMTLLALPQHSDREHDSYHVLKPSYFGTTRDGWLYQPDAERTGFRYGRHHRDYTDNGYSFRANQASAKPSCEKAVAVNDHTISTRCSVPLQHHLGIDVTGFGKPVVTISYATDNIRPDAALVTIYSPKRQSYAGARANVTSTPDQTTAMTIKGSGASGEHTIHIQVPKESRGLYSLSMRVNSALNITAGVPTPPVGRLLVAANDDIQVGPLVAYQLSLLSITGSITAQGVQVSRRLDLDGKAGVIANVSQLYWPTPVSYIFPALRRGFRRKLVELLFAFVPWWADVSNRMYGDSKKSSTLLRSSANITLTYNQNQQMDSYVELNCLNNVIFSATGEFQSRFQGWTVPWRRDEAANVTLSVNSEGQISDIAKHTAIKPEGGWRVPYRVPSDDTGASSISGKVTTNRESDAFGDSMVVARSGNNGMVALRFGDNPEPFEVEQ